MKRHLLLLLVLCAAVATHALAEKSIRTSRRPARDRYIVTFDEDRVQRANVPDVAREIVAIHGGKIVHTYTNVLSGFAVQVNEDGARRFLKDSRVSVVEQDGNFWVASQQVSPPSWGLDRIDQDPLPLDGIYTYLYGGANVRIYVVDTGVNFHQDFGSRLVGARNFVSDASGNVNPSDTGDCYGHGTQAASVAGGTSFGVAKAVSLYNVRVYACTSDDTHVSDWIAGLDWVAGQKIANPSQQAIISMSLEYYPYSMLDDAVIRAVAAGITVVVAAGNDSDDACNWSPARLGNPNSYSVNPNGYSAITVGAVSDADSKMSYSNFGTCVDIFAPGNLLTAADPRSFTGSTAYGGTSGATPHVSGVAALRLEQEPGLSPATVEFRIKGYASRDRLTNIGAGSPNLLVYSLTRKRRACCS